MLGGIAAVIIVIWFYRSAEARGLPPIQWGFAGLIAYYVPNFIWSLLVAKPWLVSLHAQNAAGLSSIVGHSSILIGAAAAAAVHFLALVRARTR